MNETKSKQRPDSFDQPTAHTPGPWTIGRDETPWTEGDAEIAQHYGDPFGPTEILFSISGEEGMVAMCPWRPGDTEQDQEVLRANARLIAAAPEMLAMLEEIETALQSRADADDEEEDWLLQPVRNLIAKARGE